ncbi:MAG: imelysin family protein [Bacteroidota bacterium]
MKRSYPTFPFYTLLLSVLLVLSACNSEPQGPTDEQFQAAAETYTDIVLASYQDSYDEAVKLKTVIDEFVESPTEERFVACKEQWLKAREPYGQTEAYRFYGGPIDDEDGPEGLINAWPMDENFIDYVEGEPEVGLINDLETYPEINKELLEELNESFSEESIFTGYHAIEFLLWGQDFYADSPGRRPYTDYIEGGTAANPDRRGQYLKLTTELLLDHLGAVKAEWETEGAYRASFLALPKDEIVTKIFTALGELSKGELSGERMFVAVDSEDQENEHSCFADNTIADIAGNFAGMVNVYRGSYARVDGTLVEGTGFAELAAQINAEKAKAVDTAIDTTERAIAAIPGPFDQAILNNKEEILAAVTALEDLSDAFADVSFELKK